MNGMSDVTVIKGYTNKIDLTWMNKWMHLYWRGFLSLFLQFWLRPAHVPGLRRVPGRLPLHSVHAGHRHRRVPAPAPHRRQGRELPCLKSRGAFLFKPDPTRPPCGTRMCRFGFLFPSFPTWSFPFFLALDCFSSYVGNRVAFCFPRLDDACIYPAPKKPLKELECVRYRWWISPFINNLTGDIAMMLALKKGLEAGVKNSLERTDVLFFFMRIWM